MLRGFAGRLIADLARALASDADRHSRISELEAHLAQAGILNEELHADAERYRFWRTIVLREPMARNAFGQPTYGWTLDAPHDVAPAVLDRFLDEARARDTGGMTFEIPVAAIESQAVARG